MVQLRSTVPKFVQPQETASAEEVAAKARGLTVVTNLENLRHELAIS